MSNMQPWLNFYVTFNKLGFLINCLVFKSMIIGNTLTFLKKKIQNSIKWEPYYY